MTVFTIQKGGLIIAKKAGIDTLLVSNRGKKISVPVLVDSNFKFASLYSNSIDFPVITDKGIDDGPFGLLASATSGDAVSFSLISGNASLENGVLVINGPGKVTVKASQAGNIYFGAAPDVVRTFCANPSKPRISKSDTTVFCEGGKVAFTSSSSINNQWYKDGIAINGATAQIYQATQAGTYSAKVITADGCASASSSTFTVIVNPNPPNPTINATGNIFTSSSATGNQWFLNGTLIQGATGSTYTANNSGFYSVQVISVNGCKSVMSDSIDFRVTAIVSPSWNNTIQIFPNPTHSKLYIKKPSTRILVVKLLDINGRIVLQTRLSDSNGFINVGHLPNSNYIIELIDERTGERAYRKIIKK